MILSDPENLASHSVFTQIKSTRDLILCWGDCDGVYLGESCILKHLSPPKKIRDVGKTLYKIPNKRTNNVQVNQAKLI